MIVSELLLLVVWAVAIAIAIVIVIGLAWVGRLQRLDEHSEYGVRGVVRSSSVESDAG